MKKDGKYRFSLQFSAVSDEQIQVGEFLERLGNRKSAVIVAALTEYLTSHPELAESNHITVRVMGTVSQQNMKAMVQSLIAEALAEIPSVSTTQPEIPELKETLEDDVTEMLGNLNMFL